MQLNADNKIAGNIQTACDFITEASAMGADMVLLPEYSVMMTSSSDSIRTEARVEGEHPALPAFKAAAKKAGVWLHAGSLAIQTDGGKIANRSYVISPDGDVVATYDKIHMFDVDLSETESYRESDTYQPGNTAKIVNLPWGRMGLSTCYDVRFPYLYRTMARRGADMFCVPAAFTRTSGKAHWHVLLRARAIENGCFVMAPAQTGSHPGGVETYGHALIINPWGEIIADAGEAPGIIIADIDTAEVKNAREKIPSLNSDMDF